MTKDEIKLDARELQLKTLFDKQQKRIEKLEKENAELIQENEEMKKGLGCETCQIHLEYMRLNDKIRELEQKLEQTEEDLADYQFNYPTIKELEKENAELKERVDNLYNSDCWASDQLTKAKEIIKDLLEYSKEHWLYSDIKKQAEQFLKEIEK